MDPEPSDIPELYSDLPIHPGWVVVPSEYESSQHQQTIAQERDRIQEELKHEKAKTAQLETEKAVLTKNLVSLLKTARSELARKQRIIDELRASSQKTRD